MSKNYRAALSACLGDPVDGNPTGVMQEAAFAACGLNWRILPVCGFHSSTSCAPEITI